MIYEDGYVPYVFKRRYNVMLENIKSMINQKREWQESAEIIFEDANVGDLDDLIILGEETGNEVDVMEAEEEKAPEEDTPKEDENKNEDILDSPVNGDDNDASAEEDNAPTEDILDSPVGGGDEPAEDNQETPVAEPGAGDDGTDDLLNVTFDLKSNTLTDVLPVPPDNASEAISDDILDAKVDGGFEEDQGSDGDTSAPTEETEPALEETGNDMLDEIIGKESYYDEYDLGSLVDGPIVEAASGKNKKEIKAIISLIGVKAEKMGTENKYNFRPFADVEILMKTVVPAGAVSGAIGGAIGRTLGSLIASKIWGGAICKNLLNWMASGAFHGAIIGASAAVLSSVLSPILHKAYIRHLRADRSFKTKLWQMAGLVICESKDLDKALKLYKSAFKEVLGEYTLNPVRLDIEADFSTNGIKNGESIYLIIVDNESSGEEVISIAGNKDDKAAPEKEKDSVKKESYENDLLSEAITLGGSEGGDDPAPAEEPPIEDPGATPDTSGDESQVTAAVKDKVSEMDTVTPDAGATGDVSGRDEILRKLGSMTKGIEDAKNLVMKHVQ